MVTEAPSWAFGILCDEAISIMSSPCPPSPVLTLKGRILYAPIWPTRHISNSRSCSGSPMFAPRTRKFSFMGITLSTLMLSVPGKRISPVAREKAFGKAIIRLRKSPTPLVTCPETTNGIVTMFNPSPARLQEVNDQSLSAMQFITPARIFVLNVPGCDICSCEHATCIPKIFRQTKTAAASSPASTGVKSMAETPDRIRQILEKIREETDQALALLNGAGLAEERALGWKCTGCGYVKHFTRPASFEVVGRCPRCRSDQFRPVRLLKAHE